MQQDLDFSDGGIRFHLFMENAGIIKKKSQFLTNLSEVYLRLMSRLIKIQSETKSAAGRVVFK